MISETVSTVISHCTFPCYLSVVCTLGPAPTFCLEINGSAARHLLFNCEVQTKVYFLAASQNITAVYLGLEKERERGGGGDEEEGKRKQWQYADHSLFTGQFVQMLQIAPVTDLFLFAPSPESEQ